MAIHTLAQPQLQRIALLSVHTCPLDPPGIGDAGGMNVYIAQTARRLAARGVEVDVYTRSTCLDQPAIAKPDPGVRVIHLTAGPDGLRKEDLPSQLVAVSAGLIESARAENRQYDLIHSHYWLSGQVGWLAAAQWQVPLVHTMHTIAKVKNLALAAGDQPEPQLRVIGEEQVVRAASRLVANTHREAAELIEHYDADPDRVSVVHPGVDLGVFTIGDGQVAARSRHGVPQDAVVLLFVGRLQPLKAPDVLVRVAARLLAERPELADRLQILICGGPSGSGQGTPALLARLVQELGLDGRVKLLPPADSHSLADLYRLADYVVVPSYSESFGLVAIEAQACGTPVVAAAVGGLVTAVKDGVSGALVAGHDEATWAATLAQLLSHPARRAALSVGAVAHAAKFSWEQTADDLMQVYQRTLLESGGQPVPAIGESQAVRHQA